MLQGRSRGLGILLFNIEDRYDPYPSSEKEKDGERKESANHKSILKSNSYARKSSDFSIF